MADDALDPETARAAAAIIMTIYNGKVLSPHDSHISDLSGKKPHEI